MSNTPKEDKYVLIVALTRDVAADAREASMTHDTEGGVVRKQLEKQGFSVLKVLGPRTMDTAKAMAKEVDQGEGDELLRRLSLLPLITDLKAVGEKMAVAFEAMEGLGMKMPDKLRHALVQLNQLTPGMLRRHTLALERLVGELKEQNKELRSYFKDFASDMEDMARNVRGKEDDLETIDTGDL